MDGLRKTASVAGGVQHGVENEYRMDRTDNSD
jgi:hypothetical protein